MDLIGIKVDDVRVVAALLKADYAEVSMDQIIQACHNNFTRFYLKDLA